MQRRRKRLQLLAGLLIGSNILTGMNVTALASEEPAPQEDYEAAEQEGEEAAKGSDLYTVLRDDNGNVYDLGGMEIIIRDWFSGDGVVSEPQTQAEKDLKEYHDWIQKTYNFKIKKMSEGMSDWGSAPYDFVDYVSVGGDDNNYVFTLYDRAETTDALLRGLGHDLATLDCLDFTEKKFQNDPVHEKYALNGHIYAMAAGYGEPRTGVFFNKRMLKELNIDPESIYDMQAAGTWTWDKFTELCKKVQRDTDGDGRIDVYAVGANVSAFNRAALFSNDGRIVDKNDKGEYILTSDDEKTVKALKYAREIYDNYWVEIPEEAMWDYYKGAFQEGKYAFCVEDAWSAAQYGYLSPGNMQEEIGFVMFPKGPDAKDYVNVLSDNLQVIPACYDAERAWKIAFAWNLYTNEPDSCKDVWKNSYYAGNFDERGVEETLTMMKKKFVVAHEDMISAVYNGGEIWWGMNSCLTAEEWLEARRETWEKAVKEMNERLPAAAKLSITRQPKDVTVAKAGKTATVSIGATGNGLTYTWYYKDPGKSKFTAVKGEGAKYSVKVTKAKNGCKVYCVVKDKLGNSLQSNTVTLKIADAVKITSQPKNVTVAKAGKTATVKIKAKGDGLTYTWYYKDPGKKKFTAVKGKGEKYSVKVTKARNGRKVYCVVKDKYGNKVKSKTVTIKIKK